MVENQIVIIEPRIKLTQSITEKTRPESNSNICNNIRGNNNLNSILKKMDDETGLQYIDMPRIETAKINNNNINIDEDKNDKLILNTTTKKGNKKNIDLYFLPKRVDANGNDIVKGGKHRVTFIDKITQKSFYEVINIESFKEYNKMYENKSSSNNKFNSCCVII